MTAVQEKRHAGGPTSDPVGNQLVVATGTTLTEHARNRFALVLLVVFVPVWYLVIGAMVPHDPLQFRLRSIDQLVALDGHDLTLITSGMNAITLIVGFVVLSATRRALSFDRRLILAGFAKLPLVGGKVAASLVVSVAVGVYAAVVLLAYWRTSSVAGIAVGFVLASLTYAAFGLLIGGLVRGDLEGFFLIIMVALTDTFLQNPLGNPLANKPLLAWFPSYAPTQVAASAATDHGVSFAMVGLSLAWTASFILLGLIVMAVRTPSGPSQR